MRAAACRTTGVAEATNFTVRGGRVFISSDECRKRRATACESESDTGAARAAHVSFGSLTRRRMRGQVARARRAVFQTGRIPCVVSNRPSATGGAEVLSNPVIREERSHG